MQSAVKEVWARGAWLAVDMARAAGLPVPAMFEQLPFDERALRSKTRVPWDHYVMLVERINELSGGPRQLIALLEATYHKVMPEVRSLAGAAVTPQRLVAFIWSVIDPFVFPMVHFSTEELGPERLRLAAHLEPGYRPCEVWFATTRGAIRGMTRHLDLPPVDVLAEDVGPTHGVYEVRLPEAPSFAQRALRIPSAVRKLAVRIALGAANDGTPLSVQLDEHDPYAPRLQRATAAWQLDAREVELLRLVVEGHTDHSIAATLGISDATLEARIGELAAKAGARSKTQLVAAFWMRTLDR